MSFSDEIFWNPNPNRTIWIFHLSIRDQPWSGFGAARGPSVWAGGSVDAGHWTPLLTRKINQKTHQSSNLKNFKTKPENSTQQQPISLTSKSKRRVICEGLNRKEIGESKIEERQRHGRCGGASLPRREKLATTTTISLSLSLIS